MKHYVDHASLRRWGLSSSLLILGLLVFGQDIAVGTWRTHFNYTNAKHLVATSDKIFCASTYGFFSFELESGTTRKLSKIDGLSDNGISVLAYNGNLNVLVLGYQSGFIDFIFEDELLSISDVAQSNLEGDKTINDVAFLGSNTYLATDLGVIVVNTSDAEIVENYVQIGANGSSVEVFEIVARNDSLFIRTSEGLQSGVITSNLLDFSNWTRYINSSTFTDLTIANGELYAVSDADLFTFSSDSWTDSGFDLPAGGSSIDELGDQVVTTVGGEVFQLEASGFESIITTSASAINDLVSANGAIYIADGLSGLIDQSGEVVSPDGPVSDTFSNFRVISNQLYGFHAPSPFSYDGSSQVAEYSIFAEGLWQRAAISNFTNVSDVAWFNGIFYYSSIGNGLYDESNETIVSDIPGSSTSLDTVITALASGTNLWASSFENDNAIHLMDQEQNWTSYSSTFLGENEFLTIDLSTTGIGWLGASSGLITVLDPDETQVDLISTSDGLPSAFVDINISVEDNAWVATTGGPALFPDASFVFFDSNGINPTFENRTLFENEQINAVMTDGGNRIWFGTNRGLWVYDENTSEQVALFNVSNSPLPSDQIIQLEYDGSNGEVFILTAKGMVSFRSASSIGSRNHRNVNIFPNPVRPDYQGLVGLTGLARNVTIKVTDINGNLVRELKANGASASWNLTDVRGGQVGTGIYLFFSSDSAGEETYVGKIAVVR